LERKRGADEKIKDLERMEAEMLERLKNTYQAQKGAFDRLESTVNEASPMRPQKTVGKSSPKSKD